MLCVPRWRRTHIISSRWCRCCWIFLLRSHSFNWILQQIFQDCQMFVIKILSKMMKGDFPLEMPWCSSTYNLYLRTVLELIKLTRNHNLCKHWIIPFSTMPTQYSAPTRSTVSTCLWAVLIFFKRKRCFYKLVKHIRACVGVMLENSGLEDELMQVL